MMLTTRGGHETESVGAALGELLREGDLVVLGGDLGAGKTTFVKGVARALGVQEPVTSPTFTIVQEYDGPVPVAHVDIYRLDRVQELHDLGLEELLDDAVVLVEWGDVVAPLSRRARRGAAHHRRRARHPHDRDRGARWPVGGARRARRRPGRSPGA